MVSHLRDDLATFLDEIPTLLKEGSEPSANAPGGLLVRPVAVWLMTPQLGGGARLLHLINGPLDDAATRLGPVFCQHGEEEGFAIGDEDHGVFLFWTATVMEEPAD